MDTFGLVSYCLLFVILLGASWAFGNMVRAIGNSVGWNPKSTFWISAVTYGLVGYIVPQTAALLGVFGYGNTPNTIIWGFTLVAPIYLIIGASLNKKYQRKTLLREPGKQPPRGEAPHAVFDPVEKRVEAASEIVTVPQGVTIRVKRSRTVQHTISINWNVSGEVSGDIGLKQIVDVTIRAAVERSQQTAYQESETVEYEVELNGNTSKGYKLVWTDVWKLGCVEVEGNARQYQIPFEYRERSELNVVPISG